MLSLLVRRAFPHIVTVMGGYQGRKFAKKTVRFGIRILCKDRPALKGYITMTLRAGLTVVHGLDDAERVTPGPGDKELFEQGPKGSHEVLDHWHKQGLGGHVIDYSKVRYAGGVYQVRPRRWHGSQGNC